ncbi:MAG: hypothetical protein AAB036_01940 [Elusimicrobiota bacterium]
MIFWLAFATLLYEIVLSRIFAYILPYHFIPLAVSLAMLGLGLGACLSIFWRRLEGPDGSAAALAALSIALLAFIAELFVHWGFVLIVASAFPPLLVLGTLMARIYGASARPERTYALDLIGGSVACLLAFRLFDRFGPITILLALACAFGIAAAAVASSRRFRLIGVMAAALSAGAAIAWMAGLVPNLGISPPCGADKPMYEAMRRENGRITDFIWGSAGRADLYEHPVFKNIKWIYNDATNSSYLVHDPDTPARKDFLRGLALNIPFALQQPHRVLIIGSGGGLEIQLAGLAGAAEIDAVEVNPATVALVRRSAEFAGRIYDVPAVNLHIEEGRRFLSSMQRPYDLIQMSLAFTSTAMSGSFTLVEGYLNTVEAYRLYLSRLAPKGLLAVLDDSRERSLRGVLTAVAVFEEKGLSSAQALRRIAVVGNSVDGTGYAYLVIVSPEELTVSMRRRLMALCRKRGFKPLWVPEFSAEEPFISLLSAGREDFSARQPLDFGPRTDDRPYFFYFGKGWISLWQTLRPIALLCLVSLLFALVTARILRTAEKHTLRPAALSALCGVSFMLVESGLLQKLMLATRSPAQVLSLLLFSLLFWCGVGSRLAEFLQRRRRFQLWGAFAAAAAATAAAAIFLDHRALEGVPSEMQRHALVFLFLAPVGLSLGMPFPLLLKQQASRPRVNALLWGINGFASVGGACLALMISFVVGIRMSMLAGAVGYLAAALLSYRSQASARRQEVGSNAVSA